MLLMNDSSIARPTLAQAMAFKAAGGAAWGGYLPPGVGLESPWDEESFLNVLEAGLLAVGFSSGNDDPVTVAATARSWGVVGCLDDEAGIRATSGWWQQPWLDASGFGHYGLCAQVRSSWARFHIVARYPGGDPGLSWDPLCPDPGGIRGWQWLGTHDDITTGLSVDTSWLDEGFLALASPTVPLQGGSRTMVGFEFNGTQHTLELSVPGTVLWGRATGGAGGQVHTQFVDLGPPPPFVTVEFTAWPTTGGTIIVRAKGANGAVQQTWLAADGAWPQTVTWFGPDVTGPFGVGALSAKDQALRDGLHGLPT